MADLCFMPHGALAQKLVHIINPASQVRAQAIEPPEPVETPLPCRPTVDGDLLHGEGLFDILRPKLEITCRSIFTPSSRVWRWLTPEEFLQVFDVPLFLIPQLMEDWQTSSLFLRSLSPLIVASIFCSMWAGVWGEGERGLVRGMKSRLVRIFTCKNQGRRDRMQDPTLLEWRQGKMANRRLRFKR
jgi:hypothetical protein